MPSKKKCPPGWVKADTKKGSKCRNANKWVLAENKKNYIRAGTFENKEKSDSGGGWSQ